MYQFYGPQYWWPGSDEPFVVMVGAVLTQNTAWTNVEKALARLEASKSLSPEAIHALPMKSLAERIRPSGYFNIKADRLKHLTTWYQSSGGFERLRRQSTQVLRKRLLAVKGVGPETCDDILLYAFQRPVFVVDAYTFRIFERLGLIGVGLGYEALRAAVEKVTRRKSRCARVRRFNEFHALIVRHGSQVCRPKPRCRDCALATVCDYNLAFPRESNSGREA
nr:endonuclease [Natronospira proteinivora]